MQVFSLRLTNLHCNGTNYPVQSDKETACFKDFKQSLEDKALTTSLAKSINIEIALIYEVKDICDELHLVLRVFQNQRDVLEKFSNIFWPGTSDSAKKFREQFMQDCGVEALIKRADKLVADAIRTLDAVSKLPFVPTSIPFFLTFSKLDYLVQTKQAQASLSEAEAAGRLNNYIMLFTVVTVIFVRLTV